MKLAVALLPGLAATGCYAPDLAPCAVRCADDEGCPGDRACGDDGFCHPPGDETVCDGPPPAGCVRRLVAGAGDYHFCALLVDDTLWCWGNNDFGQLGVGDIVSRSAPVRVPLDEVRSAATGYCHACAVTAGGTYCWGSDSHGQLGVPGGNVSAPARVTVPTATALGAGDEHTCVTTEAGVYCWGRGEVGQNGQTAPNEAPALVPSEADFRPVALAGGDTFSCALDDAGDVWCWGDARVLGTGVASSSSTPRQVTALPDAVALTAGVFHACALDADGGVWCWGAGDVGQLGQGSWADAPVPVRVPSLPPVARLAAGENHTCAVTATHELHCWGGNGTGQIGDGRTTTVLSPSRVDLRLGLTGVVDVAGTYGSTCALDGAGDVWCWGLNSSGQVGLPPSQDAVLEPSRLPAFVCSGS